MKLYYISYGSKVTALFPKSIVKVQEDKSNFKSVIIKKFLFGKTFGILDIYNTFESISLI